MNLFIKQMTDRMTDVSAACQEYMDAGLYKKEMEEVTLENVSLDQCFPTLLEYIRQDLKELGIRLTISIDELYENSRHIEGLVCLREIFDKDYLAHILKGNDDVMMRLRCLAESADLQVESFIFVVLEILQNLRIGDRVKIEAAMEMEEIVKSTPMFVKHLTAVLDDIPPISPYTDESLQAATYMARVVMRLRKFYLEAFKLVDTIAGVSNAGITGENLFRKYAWRYTQVEYAAAYKWSLENEDWNLANAAILKKLQHDHDLETHGHYNYYHNRMMPTFEDGIMMFIDILMHLWAATREPMKEFQPLYQEPGEDTTHGVDHTDPIFNLCKEKLPEATELWKALYEMVKELGA